MVLVIKLTSFGWCLFDGTRPDTELSESQKQKKIVDHPSLIEFAGYVFYFGGFLVGPAFEFSDYISFINGAPPFDKLPENRLSPTLKCVSSALICMAIYAGLSPVCNLNVYISSNVIEHPSFLYR